MPKAKHPRGSVRLTEKQKIFVHEYLKDMNSVEAVMKAYPSYKGRREAASKYGYELRNMPKVKEYIDQVMEQIKADDIADVTEVMRYLTKVMRGNAESEEVLVVGDGEGVSHIEHTLKNPSEKDRLRAAELIGKRYSMFTDKVQADVVLPVFEGEDDLEE